MGIDAKSVLLWAAAALRFRDGLRISNVIGADIWYFQMIRKDLFFEGMLVMSSLAQNKCKLRGGLGTVVSPSFSSTSSIITTFSFKIT